MWATLPTKTKYSSGGLSSLSPIPPLRDRQQRRRHGSHPRDVRHQRGGLRLARAGPARSARPRPAGLALVWTKRPFDERSSTIPCWRTPLIQSAHASRFFSPRFTTLVHAASRFGPPAFFGRTGCRLEKRFCRLRRPATARRSACGSAGSGARPRGAARAAGTPRAVAPRSGASRTGPKGVTGCRITVIAGVDRRDAGRSLVDLGVLARRRHHHLHDHLGARRATGGSARAPRGRARPGRRADPTRGARRSRASSPSTPRRSSPDHAARAPSAAAPWVSSWMRGPARAARARARATASGWSSGSPPVRLTKRWRSARAPARRRSRRRAAPGSGSPRCSPLPRRSSMRHSLGRLPGVRRVAPAAAQVAVAEAHEERRGADVRPLALHGGEDLDQVGCRRQAYASTIERPIAISAITSSRRSGPRGDRARACARRGRRRGAPRSSRASTRGAHHAARDRGRACRALRRRAARPARCPRDAASESCAS